MLKEMLQEIAVVLLVVALAMLGTATKLKTARNIKLQGAVSGNANFDGSGNITINTILGNIAVLVETITMPEANSNNLQGSTDMNYPSGFTNTNCVVISVMSHNSIHADWWGTPRSHTINANAVVGNGDTCAILKPDKITIHSYKLVNEQERDDIAFKIVLMKIEDKSYKLGDVNGDGQINNLDVQKIADYIQGNTTLTLEQYKAADVNKDGYINTGDTYKLQQFISGTISSLE